MPLLKRSAKNRPAATQGSIYGVGFTIAASSDTLLTAALSLMPPAWAGGPAGADALNLRLEQDGGTVRLYHDERELSAGTLDEVSEDLDRTIRLHLAFNAPGHLFLHAGAVSYRGQGIVIPGASFSGKTTLVAALVRAGAEYYSDENAVFDAAGLLHPYPKPLGVRLSPGEPDQTNQHVSAIGGRSGEATVPLALVVAAEYQPGAGWEPAQLSPSEVVTVLLQHAYRGLSRPQESIDILRRAATDAVGLSGKRGDADAVAADLLARVDARIA